MPTTPGSLARSTRSTAPTAAHTRPRPTTPAAATPPAHPFAGPRPAAVPLHQLLTTAEVANQLRVDVRTVRRYIDARELPAYRVGRAYRIHPADLARYLGACRVSLQLDAEA